MHFRARQSILRVICSHIVQPPSTFLFFSFSSLAIILPLPSFLHNVPLHLFTCGSIPIAVKPLHWLSVNCRFKFKLSPITYCALAIHHPPYLASLLHLSKIPRKLRSSTSQQLYIPRTKLNLVKCAFSVAAPVIWNELPATLKFCERIASFHTNLKRYVLKITFPP